MLLRAAAAVPSDERYLAVSGPFRLSFSIVHTRMGSRLALCYLTVSLVTTFVRHLPAFIMSFGYV